MKKKKAIFLLAQLMGYTLSGLRKLVEYDIDPVVIHFDENLKHPRFQPTLEIEIHPRSSFIDAYQLYRFIQDKQPAILYVAGWMDKDYLKAIRLLKKSIPIVVGIDNQWLGTFRQRVGKFIFPYTLLKQFDYAWVAGVRQYEYARRIGFRENQILFSVYSANLEAFTPLYDKYAICKERAYPKSLLYVGRFSKVKGLTNLVNCFLAVDKEKRNGWKLTLVGNGTINVPEHGQEDIDVKGYMNAEELAQEVKNAGCFVLPSLYEPWGVVLHEFSAAGLPLICTDACGASTAFLINNYNGFLIPTNDEVSLRNVLVKLFRMNNEELNLLSKRSHKLAQRITPDIWAASFLSILK